MPIWADNSNSTNDNPNGANRALDVYTDEIWVFTYSDTASATTLQLGSSSFTTVPRVSLLEAAMLLVAQRTFPGRVPTGAEFDQFVLHMYRATQRLADLASRSPTSPAAILLGWPVRRSAPTLQAIDGFFRQAWADGLLTAADLTLRLG